MKNMKKEQYKQRNIFKTLKTALFVSISCNKLLANSLLNVIQIIIMIIILLPPQDTPSNK